MKPSEWNSTVASPLKLFERVRLSASSRKLMLLGAGVCGLLEEHSPVPSVPLAMKEFTYYVDGLLSNDLFLDARDRIWIHEGKAQQEVDANGGDWFPNALGYAYLAACASAVNPDVHAGTARALWYVTEGVTRAAPAGKKQASQTEIRKQICDLIREIFPNPYTAYQRNPPWNPAEIRQADQQMIPLNENCTGLAEAIHRTGDFTRMPILADALEDSGMTDLDILHHCRGADTHLRGCWVLDLVRGRS
jgi:hypothetical protein